MFKDGTIELVPAFKQQDGSFIYPDSNNGGKWKYTKPLEEIQLAMRAKNDSSDLYNYLCFLLRKWKNHKGFVFKGLLIDTLVFNYLNNVNYRDLLMIKRFYITSPLPAVLAVGWYFRQGCSVRFLLR